MITLFSYILNMHSFINLVIDYVVMLEIINWCWYPFIEIVEYRCVKVFNLFINYEFMNLFIRH